MLQSRCSNSFPWLDADSINFLVAITNSYFNSASSIQVRPSLLCSSIFTEILFKETLPDENCRVSVSLQIVEVHFPHDLGFSSRCPAVAHYSSKILNYSAATQA
jgi:hypothetical protein